MFKTENHKCITILARKTKRSFALINAISSSSFLFEKKK